jgi:hypothetical protein
MLLASLPIDRYDVICGTLELGCADAVGIE